MSNIDIEKQELRTKYILIRTQIENRELKSKIIINKIIEDADYKQAKVVAAYKSLESEVDTALLIKHALNNKKIIALPKVVGNEIEFYKINSAQNVFIKSEFGVEEPEENKNNFIPKNKIDLIIVPGICFDKENNRLGFGKGYYDRYLKTSTANSIGICFNEQVVESIPTTNNDIKVGKIITN